MNAAHPPRLATWLLQRWGSGPRRASLIGDLIEQYQRGHSPAWYWRQVVRAILVGAVHDVRDHKLLAVRAAVSGVLVMWFSAYLVQTGYNAASMVIWNWTITHGWDTARMLWFGSPRFMQPLFQAAMWIRAAIIGWSIARLHQGHSLAMVSSCAGFYYVATQAGGLWTVGLTRFVHVNAMRPMLPVLLLTGPAIILLGGLVGSRPDRDAPEQIVIGR